MINWNREKGGGKGKRESTGSASGEVLYLVLHASNPHSVNGRHWGGVKGRGRKKPQGERTCRNVSLLRRRCPGEGKRVRIRK